MLQLSNVAVLILKKKKPFVKIKTIQLPFQETCTLKFKNARVVKQPLKTEWCLDEDQVVPSQYCDDMMLRSIGNVIDLPNFTGVGGGGGDEREDDIPPTGAGSLDQPPGIILKFYFLRDNCTLTILSGSSYGSPPSESYSADLIKVAELR